MSWGIANDFCKPTAPRPICACLLCDIAGEGAGSLLDLKCPLQSRRVSLSSFPINGTQSIRLSRTPGAAIRQPLIDQTHSRRCRLSATRPAPASFCVSPMNAREAGLLVGLEAHEWHLLFSWTDRSGPSRHLCLGALVKNAPAKLHSQRLASGPVDRRITTKANGSFAVPLPFPRACAIGTQPPPTRCE
jgi:hypothetical protein